MAPKGYETAPFQGKVVVPFLKSVTHKWHTCQKIRTDTLPQDEADGRVPDNKWQSDALSFSKVAKTATLKTDSKPRISR